LSDGRIVRRCASLPFVLVAFATMGCAPGLHSVRLRTADGEVRTTVPRPRPPLALKDEHVHKAVQVLARKVVPVADPLELARQRFEVPTRDKQREAEVALDMEEQGRLKEPIRRPAPQDGHSGDFVDGNGQDWDVKRPHSRAQVEENIRQRFAAEGRPPPRFDPNRTLEGAFDLKVTLKDIQAELAGGENVIVDTSKLNSADLAALRQALIDEGILGTKVLLYP